MKRDSEIQKDVMDELKWEPVLNATEVGVAVKDGVVTLSGTVDSYAKKLAAEKAASKVSGVKAVAEDIEVKFFTTLKKSDSEIAQEIAAALKWNSEVNEDKVKVKVEDGWATLTGEVEWEFQKTSIWKSIEHLRGLKGISNFINVVPTVKMIDVEQKISSAFQRHAMLDAEQIDIDVAGNKVILSGTVRSLAEKRDAESAAWSTPGISQVENNLEVNFFQASSAR